MVGFLVVLAAAAAAEQPLTITLEDALTRARANAPQLYSATLAAEGAHEDRVQARAAMLPSVNWNNQFIYTQPNGTPSGVFISNDGPHVYNNQMVVHGEILSPARRAEYRRTIAAEAVARAKADVAARGLVATVVGNYYALVAGERRSVHAHESLREAEQFLDITRKQERGGEAAHADVVKAEIQAEQRRRDSEEAQLAAEKSRAALAVLLFPEFRLDFTAADDLGSAVSLPPFEEVRALAARSNPDLRAAEQTVAQETSAVSVARSANLPTLSFDYFYGINANQYALYNREHLNNVGSALQAQMTIPIWNWGANRSKVRQAGLRLEQAKRDLSLAGREMLANLHTLYLEAQLAGSQTASLEHSADLAAQGLRLTLLRYEAGEATALEVVDAQTTLAQARNAYDDGLVRRRLARANLQTITGAF
jgi:outer membrane protein TolC